METFVEENGTQRGWPLLRARSLMYFYLSDLAYRGRAPVMKVSLIN